MPLKIASIAALAVMLSLGLMQPATAGRALRDATSDAIEKTRQCLTAAIDGAQAVSSCGEPELTTECVQDLGTAVQDNADFVGCGRTLQDVLPKLPALVGQPIKDAINTAANQVSGGASTAVDAVKGAAGTAAGAVKDAAGTAVDAAKGAAGTAAGAVKDAAGTAVDAAKGAAGTAVDGAKDAASKVGSAFEGAGSEIASWFG